jgi:uncharacterized membrane protein YraQ (UPF0718 family)
MEEILKITTYVLKAFLHIWPYLLISILLAVVVQMSGAAKYITRISSKNPFVSILLATIIGAASPFCSCGVIPVITSMLIGGVPLAPVMSFWIASPSMDPEIFMLSVTAIGWKLSIWRLGATFIISFGAGIITHFCMKYGFIDLRILREKPQWTKAFSFKSTIFQPVRSVFIQFTGKTIREKEQTVSNVRATYSYVPSVACCTETICCAQLNTSQQKVISSSVDNCEYDCNEEIKQPTFINKLALETGKAVWMVTKFMSLAFLINAIIDLYIPQTDLLQFIKNDSPLSIFVAALIGIPFYTSNMTALPMISGLLKLGMNQGAALAFLIAGPVTTIPAMVAVYGIVKKRIFLLYLAFSFFGALIFGYLFNLFC